MTGAGTPVTGFIFSVFVAQENGSSSQQMDDLFDILIQSGGKAQNPKLLLQPLLSTGLQSRGGLICWVLFGY